MSHPFEKLAGLVGRLPPGPDEPAAPAPTPAANPLGGRIVVRRERKGRGGKTVTVVQGVALRDEPLDAFARELRRALGCGASIEQGDIVLQGDLIDRVEDHLRRLGAEKVVRGSA